MQREHLGPGVGLVADTAPVPAIRGQPRSIRSMLKALIDNATESLTHRDGDHHGSDLHGARRQDRGRGPGRRNRSVHRGPGTGGGSVLHDQARASGYRPDDRQKHLATTSADSRSSRVSRAGAPWYAARSPAPPGPDRRTPCRRSFGLNRGSDDSPPCRGDVGARTWRPGHGWPGSGRARSKGSSPRPSYRHRGSSPVRSDRPVRSVNSRQMESPRPLPSILECSSRERR